MKNLQNKKYPLKDPKRKDQIKPTTKSPSKTKNQNNHKKLKKITNKVKDKCQRKRKMKERNSKMKKTKDPSVWKEESRNLTLHKTFRKCKKTKLKSKLMKSTRRDLHWERKHTSESLARISTDPLILKGVPVNFKVWGELFWKDGLDVSSHP